MAYLLDTNILLRSVQPDHPMHGAALAAVGRLGRTQERVTLAGLYKLIRRKWAASPDFIGFW